MATWNLECSQKSRESISVICSCKVENLVVMNTDTREKAGSRERCPP